MSNKLKYSLAILVFITFWLMFHRLSTAASPPKFVELIVMSFYALIINIFTIYYAFIYKIKQDEKRQILNWRQLFVIAMAILLVVYRVYFAFEDIQRGMIDRRGIIQHNTVWVIGVLFIAGIWAFLLRDKRPSGQK